MVQRIIILLAALCLLLGSFAPANAATAISYSAKDNAYGWCAGVANSRASGCADEYCAKNGGTKCDMAVECDGNGWGAGTFAKSPVEGFSGTCDKSDDFWARIVALDSCLVAAKALCWTNATFDARGNTLSDDSNRQFDLLFYAQTALQIRFYYDGSTDGTRGAKTIAAVKKFQSDLGRDPTGIVDEELVDRMMDSVGGVQVFAQHAQDDFLTPHAKDIGDSVISYGEAAPDMSFTEDLLKRSEADRLLALATVISTSGDKCTLPALDATPPADTSKIDWHVTCKEGPFEFIIADGKRTIVSGADAALPATNSGNAGAKLTPNAGNAPAASDTTPAAPASDTGSTGHDMTPHHH